MRNLRTDAALAVEANGDLRTNEVCPRNSACWTEFFSECFRKNPLSVPKITSAHTDGAVPTRWEWRRSVHTAELLGTTVHFPERQVGARLVVVGGIQSEDMSQMSGTHDQHVIQTLVSSSSQKKPGWSCSTLIRSAVMASISSLSLLGLTLSSDGMG